MKNANECRYDNFFFFFQAEDGIRDYKVTGVQTCALPISRGPRLRVEGEVVEDIALSVSGLLNSKIGGPSIYPPIPSSAGDTVYGGFNWPDRKSTRLNSSHLVISYAVFCLKKKKNKTNTDIIPNTRVRSSYVDVRD